MMHNNEVKTKKQSISPSLTGKNAEIVRPDVVTGVRTLIPPLTYVSL